MPDNLQPPSEGGFPLPGYRILALEGRDATAFAQAQCMNEVAALPAGHWQWNGWLTPKGRVIALFALLKLADDMLWWLLPDADPGALALQLQRFVFRSKVAFRSLDDHIARGAFARPVQARGAQLDRQQVDRVELDFSGDGGARVLTIGTGQRKPDAGSEVGPDGALRWIAADLAHGLPRLGPEQTGQWTPQMLSLQRLHAFSVKKGCYPGQEIVARTHFLGQSKRGLALLECDAAAAAGSEVRGGERASGSVVSAASVDGRHLALAVLPLERDDVALQIGEIAVRELPLLDGLAR